MLSTQVLLSLLALATYAVAFQAPLHRGPHTSHHKRGRHSYDGGHFAISSNIPGRENDEDITKENIVVEAGTMNRLSFLSQSLSTVIAVSTISSYPTEAMAFERSSLPIQSPLLAASKISGDTIQETISGFFSGAALTATKTFVKYPLDTATVRLQMPNTLYSISSISNLMELFDGSFRGISLPLLSNIPGGAVFFAIKDATKSICKESGMPKWMGTLISVGVANFPYWLIRNPSEVIKTRQQANIEGYTDSVSAFDALRFALDSSNSTDTMGGVKDLYTGYWENILYAYPADVLKFLCYESLSGGRKNLSASEGAVYGAAATAVAQFFTTPLDVVRNRIMAGKSETGGNTTHVNSSYVDKCVRLAREEGVSGLFAGASPRVGKAFLSGAIQFATYEETKRSIGVIIQKK